MKHDNVVDEFQYLPNELKYTILKATPMYKRIAKSTYDHATFTHQFCEAPISAKEVLSYNINKHMTLFSTYIDEPNLFTVTTFVPSVDHNKVLYDIYINSIQIINNELVFYSWSYNKKNIPTNYLNCDYHDIQLTYNILKNRNCDTKSLSYMIDKSDVFNLYNLYNNETFEVNTDDVYSLFYYVKRYMFITSNLYSFKWLGPIQSEWLNFINNNLPYFIDSIYIRANVIIEKKLKKLQKYIKSKIIL